MLILLAPNIESLNNAFTFKEDTIKPDSMRLVKKILIKLVLMNMVRKC